MNDMLQLTKEQSEIFALCNGHIIDTHVHYNDKAFDVDREHLIPKSYELGIGRMVNIGVDVPTSKTCVALAKQYDFLYATVGLHPSDSKGKSFLDLQIYEDLARDEKVVAIGEIGLDYYWGSEYQDTQIEWFLAQLNLARKVNLPVVIHSREAAKDTLDILKAEKAGEIGGVMHCYSYGKEHAKEYVDMGMFIGIGGVSTFKNAKKLKEVIEYVPLSHIVLETDAPYLAPDPFRGKRNASIYLPYVIDAISKIKKVHPLEVIETTFENAYRLYPKMK